MREFIPEAVSNIFHSAKEFTTQIIDTDFDFGQIKDQATSIFEFGQEREQEHVEKPALTTPDEQPFSIGNVELGDTRTDVEEIYGEPMRISENEYGLDWFTYHEHYQNFMMIGYDDQKMVRGLFTNQDLVSSQFNISLGDTKEFVNETLGEPEDAIRNGRFNYLINSEGEYDVYQIDGNYVTIFYDIHEGYEFTALQLIDENLEATKNTLYTPGSEALKEGFEFQLFNLTNATRVHHNLPILKWNDSVREVARKHSTDMATNHFFSHTNLQGKSPFDRMEEDHIPFTSAAENLAYGQFSSIFAHQGLMNSLGHRENILHNVFTEVGIGVDFNDNDQPFYTEKFLAH